MNKAEFDKKVIELNDIFKLFRERNMAASYPETEEKIKKIEVNIKSVDPVFVNDNAFTYNDPYSRNQDIYHSFKNGQNLEKFGHYLDELWNLHVSPNLAKNAEKSKELNKMLNDATKACESIKTVVELSQAMNGEFKKAQAQINEIEAAYRALPDDSLFERLETAKDDLHQLTQSKPEIEGLKNDAAALKLNLETERDTFNTWKGKTQREIEHLLQGATVGGLSGSFSKQKIAIEESAYNYGRIMFWVIVVSIILTFVSIWTTDITVNDLIGHTEKMLMFILFKFSVATPLIVSFWYCASQRAKALKLAAVYAHKEAVCLSFNGFQASVSKIDNQDLNKQLSEQLLRQTLETIAENPAHQLSKPSKHIDHGQAPEFIKLLKEVRSLWNKSDPLP
jgi:hypothetical protein